MKSPLVAGSLLLSIVAPSMAHAQVLQQPPPYQPPAYQPPAYQAPPYQPPPVQPQVQPNYGSSDGRSSRGLRTGARVDIAIHGGFTREMPSLPGLYTPNGFAFPSYRRSIQPGSPAGLFGFDLDTSYQTNAFVYFSLFGLRGDHVYTPDLVITTPSGAGLLLRPVQYWGVYLPGIGVSFGNASVWGSVGARMMATYFKMEGAISEGDLTVDTESSTWRFGVRAEANVCIGGGPVFGCLFVAPNLVQTGNVGAFDGGIAGLKFGAREDKR